MNSYFLVNLKKEQAAAKVQAVYRGYIVRKHFMSVRLRFEQIVKAIDRDEFEVLWPRCLIGRPELKNTKVQRRLRELWTREKQLVQDLSKVREAIRERKAHLLASLTEV